jgi:hypothetical protein
MSRTLLLVCLLLTAAVLAAHPTTALAQCDNDGDGFLSPACGGNDCNDNNATIHPGAVEIVGDSIDSNCDARELCYADADNDNWGTSSTVLSSDMDCFDAFEATVPGDCDDTNAQVYPGAFENPNNGVDDNCDGVGDPVPNERDSWGMLKARYQSAAE